MEDVGLCCFLPSTDIQCREFLRSQPFAGLWSLPAGMWLTGLSSLGLVVAGKDQMAQLMGDPTEPSSHVPVG